MDQVTDGAREPASLGRHLSLWDEENCACVLEMGTDEIRDKLSGRLNLLQSVTAEK